MANPTLLAYDRLLQEYVTSRAEAELPDAEPAAELRADALKHEVGNGPSGRAARELLVAARSGIRFTAPVPQLDDALAYLDAIVAPAVNPHHPLPFNPSLTRLRADGDVERFRRVDEVATIRLRLLNVRDRALRAEVTDASSVLRSVLGSDARERFAVRRLAREVASRHHNRDMRRYIREASIDDVAVARGRLAMTLTHGLVYECMPMTLMTAVGNDRIGGIGTQARHFLGEYVLTRQTHGLLDVPRRLAPLLDAARPNHIPTVGPAPSR